MKIIISYNMSNLDKFFSEYTMSVEAGIPLIFVRTKEPRRLLDCFTAKYASDLSSNYNIHYWNHVDTDTAYDKESSKFKKSENPVELLPSLTANYNSIIEEKTKGINIYFYQWIEEMFKIPKIQSQLWMIATRLFKFTQMVAKEGNNNSIKAHQFVILLPFGEEVPDKLKSDSKIIDFDLPTKAEILGGVLNPLLDKKSSEGKLKELIAKKDEIASVLTGMTHNEASIAFRQSLTNERLANGGSVNVYNGDNILKYLTKIKTEIIKQSECLELVNSIKEEDVGGLENLKDWIRKRKNCFSEEAKQFGVETPKGIALIGPAGTGKSMSAKLIAGMLKFPLIKFDVSSVFNKLVGGSEARVKHALKTIEAIAPCVVLIDEIDKIFNLNEGGDSGVSKRVLASILTHLQECDKPVFWVFTANRTSNLPSELLRKGRLDEIFGVTIPCEEEREEIIKIHFNKRKHSVTDIDFCKSVESSEGFVSSELEQAVKDTLIDIFNSTSKDKITDNSLLSHIENIKPLSKVFSAQFNEMAEWADKNARPANTTKKQKAIKKEIEESNNINL